MTNPFSIRTQKKKWPHVNTKLDNSYLTDEEVDGLEISVSEYVHNIWIPYKTMDACKDIQPSCPLNANVIATYTLTLYIERLYPTVSTNYCIFLLTNCCPDCSAY